MSAATATATRPLDDSRSLLKEQSPTWGNTLGLEGNAETDSRNSADTPPELQGEVGMLKRIATLTANFALRGAELNSLASGGFSIRIGGWWRELPDLQAVESTARRMGVCHE
jgi:hypothetical protein